MAKIQYQVCATAPPVDFAQSTTINRNGKFLDVVDGPNHPGPMFRSVHRNIEMVTHVEKPSQFIPTPLYSGSVDPVMFSDRVDWDADTPGFPWGAPDVTLAGFRHIIRDNRSHGEYISSIPSYVNTLSCGRGHTKGTWYRAIWCTSDGQFGLGGYWEHAGGLSCFDAPVCTLSQQHLMDKLFKWFPKQTEGLQLYMCGGDRQLLSKYRLAKTFDDITTLSPFMSSRGTWQFGRQSFEGRLKRLLNLNERFQSTQNRYVRKIADLYAEIVDIKEQDFNKSTSQILAQLSYTHQRCANGSLVGALQGKQCSEVVTCILCHCCHKCCQCYRPTVEYEAKIRQEYQGHYKIAADALRNLAKEQAGDSEEQPRSSWFTCNFGPQINIMPDLHKYIPDWLRNIPGRDWGKFFTALPIMAIGVWTSWENKLSVAMHLMAFATTVGISCKIVHAILERVTSWRGAKEQFDCPDVFGMFGGVVAMFMAYYGLSALPDDKSITSYMTRASRLGAIIVGGEKLYSIGAQVSRWLKDVIAEYVFGVPPILRDGYNTMHDWCKRVFELNTTDFEAKCRFNKEIKAKVDSLLTEGHNHLQMINTLKIPPAHLVEFQKAYLALTHMRQLCAGSGAGHLTSRPVPVVLHLFGETSTGKSAILNPLIMNALVHMGFTDPNALYDNVYWRRAMSNADFWDAYHNQVAITVVDDIGTMKDSEQNPNPEWTDAIRMSNNAVFMLNMANLADKGTTFFQSPLVIWTSNESSFGITSITNPQAVYRRINLQYEVRPRAEFSKTVMINGIARVILDEEKVAAAIAADKFAITKMVYFRKHDPLNESKDSPIEAVMTFEQVVAELLAKMDAAHAAYTNVSTAHTEYFKHLVERKTATNPSAVIAPQIEQRNAALRARATEELGNLEDVCDAPVERVVEEMTPVPPAPMCPIDVPGTSGECGYAEPGFIASLTTSFDIHYKAAERCLEYANQLNVPIALVNNQGIPRCIRISRNLTPEEEITMCNAYLSFASLRSWDQWNSAAKSIGISTKGCSDHAHQVAGLRTIDLFLQLLGAKDACPEMPISKYHKAMGYGLAAMVATLSSLVTWWAFNTGFSKLKDKWRVWRAPSSADMEHTKPGSYAEVYRNSFDESSAYNVNRTPGVRSSMPPKVEAQIEAMRDAGADDSMIHRFLVKLGIRSPQIEPPHEEGFTDPNAVELFPKLYRNSYRLELCVDGRWVHCLQVTMICGTIGLTNSHILKRFTNPDNYWRLVPAHGGPEFKFLESQLKKIAFFSEQHKRKDVMLIEFPGSVPQATDIRKHFMTREDHRGMKSVPAMTIYTLCRGNKEQGVIRSQTNEVRFLDEAVLNQEGKKTAHNCIRYSAQTRDGDCGSMLVLIDKTKPRKFAGIHSASYDQPKYNGVGMVVTVEDIEELMEELNPSERAKISIDPPVIDEMYTIGTAREQHDGAAIDHVHNPFDSPHTILGRVAEYAHQNSKTEIRPSEVCDIFPPALTKPAHLKPIHVDGQRVDPMSKARDKVLTGPNPVFDQKILDHCVNAYSQKINSGVPPGERRVLTLDEAIKGIEGDPLYPPINRQTSVGYGWPKKGKGKTYYLGADEGYVTDHPLVVAAVEAAEAKAKQGLRINAIFVDALKDERRPIAKVDQGKTRLFSVGPLHFTLLFRRYFMAFAAHMVRRRIENESAVGINVTGIDWDILSRRLRQHEHVVAGDFTNYDGTIPSEVMWRLLDVVEDFYQGTDEERRVRLVLWSEVVNSLHLYRDVLYYWTHSNPSGCPITTLLNTGVHCILARYVYIKLARIYSPSSASNSAFERNITFICYGDDDVWSIADEIVDWLNQDTLADGFAEVGMTYTDETKLGTTRVRRCDEVAFLKRKFQWNPVAGRYLAPLDLDVILEMPKWERGSQNSWEQAAERVEEAAEELALHPPEVFARHIHLFRRAAARIRQHLVPCSVLSYAEYQQIFEDRM